MDLDAATAKKAWLRVLARFTEPVPGQEGRIRVRVNAAQAESGVISVERRGDVAAGSRYREYTGQELDVGDDLFLIVFSESAPTTEQPDRVCEYAHTIFWTEIASIHVQRTRWLGAE